MKQSTPPSQHILALVTFIALVPLVYFIPDLVGHTFPDKLTRVVISVGVIVPIISCGVMPLFEEWYYFPNKVVSQEWKNKFLQ
ncbi:hypothetical protein [Enterovibrio nigricans]|uniref:Uncharacterized protein n=1 Tax=Enterovibrio nigricans DSM 22720 TaxID=1121868 RepID=A0A1T4V4P1_9GAMM|nr:hypothetical protein [Enterovibrio nigricans]SKA59905.1 hypothetical protein SAMN02745132_03199 [Enterovibrio nigricans DSM 22720]